MSTGGGGAEVGYGLDQLWFARPKSCVVCQSTLTFAPINKYVSVYHETNDSSLVSALLNCIYNLFCFGRKDVGVRCGDVRHKRLLKDTKGIVNRHRNCLLPLYTLKAVREE